MKPVTLKDLARETGFHYTTVARALKNNPLIKQSTRELIQQKAETMGYRPDPMLQALVKYRHEHNPEKSTPTIAFLSHSGPLRSIETEGGRSYYAGAKAQADRLGYQLEFFWHAEPGITDKRWSQIFTTRNIRMLITANFPSGFTDLNLDWKEFSAVKISVAPAYPPLDTVSCHQMQTVRKAIQVLRMKGFRRIAFLCDPPTDQRLGNMWSAGFLVEQMEMDEEDRIPIMDLGDRCTPQRLAALVKKWKPEILLSYSTIHLSMLQEAGIRVPEDIGFVTLNQEPGDTGLAGMQQSYFEVGRAAVNLVTKLFESNTRGLPVLPSVQYISSIWVEGRSIMDRDRMTIA